MNRRQILAAPILAIVGIIPDKSTVSINQNYNIAAGVDAEVLRQQIEPLLEQNRQQALTEMMLVGERGPELFIPRQSGNVIQDN